MWNKLMKFLFSPKCPECKKGKFDAVSRHRIFDTEHTLFRCDNCGFELWS